MPRDHFLSVVLLIGLCLVLATGLEFWLVGLVLDPRR